MADGNPISHILLYLLLLAAVDVCLIIENYFWRKYI